MTDRDVLPEKELLEKAATMERCEYLPLGKELKAHIDIAKKQYQKLDCTSELDKVIEKEKLTLKMYNKLYVIYDSNFSFFKYYCDIKKFDNLSSKSMYSFLIRFFNDLDKFNKLKPQKEETKRKKRTSLMQLQNYIMTCRNVFL